MSPSAPPWINVSAVTGLIVFIAMLLLAITGLVIMSRSGKGDMKRAASQMGVAMIGAVMLGLALVGSLIWVVIQSTVNYFINGTPTNGG